jgi:hypothetical protein
MDWKLGRTWSLAAMAAASLMAGVALAQQLGTNKPEPAAHGAQAATGATHTESPQQFLAKRAGQYTRTIRFVGEPGGPGEPSTGTSKITVIHGGLFLLEEYKDVVFGRPVSGMRLFGYNTTTGEYEAAWTYTMSPAILMLKGTSKDGGRTVDYSGDSAGANGQSFVLHVRVRQVDDDQFVMTLSMTGADGKPNTFQETTYTRKK